MKISRDVWPNDKIFISSVTLKLAEHEETSDIAVLRVFCENMRA